MSPKKIPQRMCAVCKQMKPKKEMTRIVRTPEGNIEIDYTGKKSGRGTYFCKDQKCIDNIFSEGLLSKALGCKVTKEMVKGLKEDFKTT